MPMMLDQSVDSQIMRTEEPPQCRRTHYSHSQQQATQCGHAIHPSASKHTPVCPACISSQVKARMESALEGLIAEGGLTPADYMRNRRWQRAKLRYEIANKRQARARSRDQLRMEREQAWEETHQRTSSLQATTTFDKFTDCPVCASATEHYSTALSKSQLGKDVAWWERPGALVIDQILVPRTPLRPVRAPQDASKAIGSSALRMLVREFRTAMAASDAHRRAWELRNRTELAVRRKHSLGEGYHFEPQFWDAPFSAYISRQAHQHVKDEQRMAARRARGNTTRPRPPRSSLSFSAHTDEVEVDEETLWKMKKRNEIERLERVATKVGEEIGYLYFIGDIDGLLDWREDYLRSDRQLIYRKQNPGSAPEVSKSGSNEAGSEGDTEEEEGDEYEGQDEEKDKNNEKMDIDE